METRNDAALRVPTFILAAILALGATGAAAKELPRIGILSVGAAGCRNEAFLKGMGELGYVEGENVVYECGHAKGSFDGLDAAAVEIVRTRPDVLVGFGHAAAHALRRATQDIPTVVSISGEPVRSGLVASFARPGGNLTGVSYFNTELNIKRMELFKVLVPSLKRMAVVMSPKQPADLIESYTRDSRAAGQTLGFDVRIVEATTIEELERAFGEMAKAGMQAVFLPPKQTSPKEMKRIAELALQYRLPTMHFHKGFTKEGGLMSYGVDYAVLYHRTATYVDKILKGANPAVLPVEQPARFELLVNLTTARALGLKLPEHILQRADRVIE